MSHFNVIVPVSKDLFGPEENKFIDTQDICAMQHEEDKNKLPDEYFKVMSIVENEVERLMAPYYEGLEGNDNVEDVDITDECVDAYFEKGKEFVYSNSFLSFLEEYYMAATFEKGNIDPFELDGSEIRACIDDDVEIPGESFSVEDAICAPMNDDITEERLRKIIKCGVQVLRMEAAEPKWDWYEIGGRWKNGMLYKGRTMSVEHKVTWCRVRDLMLKFDDFNEDEISYLKHQWNVLSGKEENEEKFFIPFTPEYYIKRYGNFEGYLKECQFNYPYAMINPDGYWFETGLMGYWGCDDATKESADNFHKQFDEMITALDPEDVIVTVDCHI